MDLRYCLALLLSLCVTTCGAINEVLGIDAATDSVGPDGPWAYWNVSVDYPRKFIAVFPSLLETPMMINSTACQHQDAQCPLPTVGMWSGSGAHNLFNNQTTDDLDASTLEQQKGGYVADLMGMEGSFRYTSQRWQYHTDNGTKYLDGTATIIADNISVTYPNGNFYTLGVGYMSLYGGRTFTYDLPNGTAWPLLGQLYNGYRLSAYASLSYSLHIGSPTYFIPPRLHLGGYDRARVISDPITTHSNTSFSLTDITLDTAAGASILFNNPTNAASLTGFLNTTTSTTPDPALPYLYLPAATCALLATHLPIYLDEGLGLYLWNTSNAWYEPLLVSPAALSFHFDTQSISVPLALLNLTLDWPLVSTPTPYFPCRPHDPAEGNADTPPIVLGRAFLQAATLAQNWETGTTWLAQAPGPQFKPGELREITSDATELGAFPNAGTWLESWGDALTARDGAVAEGTAVAGTLAEEEDGGGLSTGAKAGVGVGVAVGVLAVLGVIVGLAWRRRRRREEEVAEMPQGGEWEQQRMVPQELEAGERQELPAHQHQTDEAKELQAEVKRQELP